MSIEIKYDEKQLEEQQDTIKGLEKLRDQHVKQAADNDENVSISQNDDSRNLLACFT